VNFMLNGVKNHTSYKWDVVIKYVVGHTFLKITKGLSQLEIAFLFIS